jgi:uncharacterized protein (TIGR00251 family)
LAAEKFPTIESVEGGIILTVKVVPGSSKTALAGLLEGKLKIKVACPPEKGKANDCLIDFLAEKLKIKRRDLIIVSGQTNPVKRIKITGLSPDELLDRLSMEK